MPTRFPTRIDIACVESCNVVLQEEGSYVKPLFVSWEQVTVLGPQRIPSAVAFGGGGSVNTGAIS